MNILVVEDDPLLLGILQDFLKQLGHKAAGAEDGRQGWLSYDRDPVPVVVSDWNMPGLDGLELCRRVRERPRTDYSYFILLTGARTTREEYRLAMDSGVDDLLLKPIDPEMLRMRLNVAERILSLQGRLERLEGFLPVCSYCKRIRREDGAYEALEVYIGDRAGTRFSHGICPDCLKRHLPGPAEP